MLNESPVVQVDGLSKTFCKDFKRSLFYGIQDIGSEILGRSCEREVLRPGEFWAVKDVSLTLHPGDSVALIGPNGAGKTTFLRMLNGLIRPERGKICIRGRVGALIALGTGFNPVLSGRENIYVNASILGLSKREIESRIDKIIEFAEIGEFIDSPVRSYSSGMTVRLGFAVAANLEPDVLLVDEVLAVGDVAFRMKCFNRMLSLLERGTSIVFVTHNTTELHRIANRGVVFNKGKIVYDGAVDGAINSYDNLMLVNSYSSDVGRDGDVVITSVTAYSKCGEGCVRTGEPLFLRILLCSKIRVTSARIITIFEAPLIGEVANVSNGYDKIEVELQPGENEVLLTVSDFPFLVGSYQVSVSVYGPGIEDFYHRRTGAVVFSVVGPPIDTFGYGRCGLFALKTSWSGSSVKRIERPRGI